VHATVGALSLLCLFAVVYAHASYRPPSRIPVAHASQRLDELPRSNPGSGSSHAGLEREPVRASQYRRDETQIERAHPAQGAQPGQLARFLDRLRNATDPNVTELLAGISGEIRLLAEMELFSHHIHVSDAIREHHVREFDLPEVNAQFDRYREQPGDGDAERALDLALTPHVLRFIEKSRRAVVQTDPPDEKSDRL
jgi:hypothetical protein